MCKWTPWTKTRTEQKAVVRRRWLSGLSITRSPETISVFKSAVICLDGVIFCSVYIFGLNHQGRKSRKPDSDLNCLQKSFHLRSSNFRWILAKQSFKSLFSCRDLTLLGWEIQRKKYASVAFNAFPSWNCLQGKGGGSNRGLGLKRTSASIHVRWTKLFLGYSVMTVTRSRAIFHSNLFYSLL